MGEHHQLAGTQRRA